MHEMPRKRISDSNSIDSYNMASLNNRKRKRSVQYDVNEMCQDLYDTIKNHRTSADSHLVCEAFLRLPKKSRTTADYYETVTNPIDLLRIQQKIKMEEYEDVDQLTSDIELMCSNAKTYYKKTSQEYKDAGELWEVFLRTRNYLLNSDEADEAGSEDCTSRRNTRMKYDDDDNSNMTNEMLGTLSEDIKEELIDKDSTGFDTEMDADSVNLTIHEDDLEEIFSSIMLAKDDDRQICAMFQLLPSKVKYSEYYDVIKDPIDLKMIAERIQDKAYKTLDDLEKDVLLMVKNAKLFNEPGSQIYKDAETLKKLYKAKRLEIDNRRGATKSSERLRCRNDRSNAQKLSAITAALQYLEESDDSLPDTPLQGDNEEEDSGDEGTITEDKMLLWLLYNTVLSYRADEGVLSERFMKLPNKRFHPNYYVEIARPLSLSNVKKKLKHNHYMTLDDLANDLDLVFNNAMQYNMDESEIFKFAQQLQKVMRDKKHEIETTDIKDRWGDEDESGMKNRNKSRRSSLCPVSDDRRKTPGKRSVASQEDMVKRRINELYKCVAEHVDDSGRELKTIFMSLPSKKDYPDYYKVISEPIDLQVISGKIKANQYDKEQEIISDLELVFKNARHYNEETSQVYKDADVLEKVLKNKWRSYLIHDSPKRSTPSKGLKGNKPSTVHERLSNLLNSIKDHTDTHGRVLSTPFMKLPMKAEYPDYYEVIKKPIDLLRIQQKFQAGQYESCEDMVSDFVQMFDNACKYNEPDSVIYKDALTLQRVCLEKKAEFTEQSTGNCVPDVRSIIQELMMNLYISVYSYQNEDGRCLADSFSDTSPRHESDDTNEKAMTFDQIKWNLDKGRYRRVDRFQEDMFKVFERTRRLSRTDSQTYEDAVELQQYYMKTLNELCKNGEILVTPALSYTERHLTLALDKEKKEKQPLETKESGEKNQIEEEIKQLEKSEKGDFVKSVKYNDQTFTVGDFVYIQPRDQMLEPHIVHVYRLFKDNNNEWNLFGYWYYRPYETFHPANRKFLEKQVFRSDASTSTTLSQVVGRCYVMFVKDYFKHKPEGFEDKDVYVCESRYITKLKCFTKIKNWTVPKNEDIVTTSRVIPLVPLRVASVFADKTKTVEAIELGDGGTNILDKVRKNVPIEKPEKIEKPEGSLSEEENSNIYYDQYVTPAGALKPGDCVYVRSHDDRPYIARIDKLWTDIQGLAYFNGPWFLRPDEVDHPPTRLFYHNEVFLSSIEDMNSVNSILSKCSVLFFKEYTTCRITEISEDHVYICESKYQENEHCIKKLTKGIRPKFALSPLVTDDEVYFFRHPVLPSKEPSPLLIRAADDFPDATANYDITDALIDEYVPADPDKSKRKKKGTNPKQKTVSGYIVFAGVTRRKIQQSNPLATFGDISRIVGMRWRLLAREEKDRFEEKAQKIIEQKKELEALKALEAGDSVSSSQESASPAPSTEGFHLGMPYTMGPADHMAKKCYNVRDTNIKNTKAMIQSGNNELAASKGELSKSQWFGAIDTFLERSYQEQTEVSNLPDEQTESKDVTTETNSELWQRKIAKGQGDNNEAEVIKVEKEEKTFKSVLDRDIPTHPTDVDTLEESIPPQKRRKTVKSSKMPSATVEMNDATDCSQIVAIIEAVCCCLEGVSKVLSEQEAKKDKIDYFCDYISAELKEIQDPDILDDCIDQILSIVLNAKKKKRLMEKKSQLDDRK